MTTGAKPVLKESAALKLASCKALDVNAPGLVAAWMPTLKPGYLLDGNDVDVKVTFDSLKNFSTYHNALRIALAKS